MKHDFCENAGAERFACLLNFTWDAVSGTIPPGLAHLADDSLKLLAEGGKWKGCWSQNYFGMVGITPFLSGRLLEYHTHTLELFFELQGDGKRCDDHGFVPPVGVVPEYVTLKDGVPQPRYKNDESSGLAEEFDFWVEGNAVSVLSLCDVLLARRDAEKTTRLLPKIEKTLEWLLSRRDEKTGLLKTGAAGTLIERAYGATFRSKGVSEYGLPSGTVVNTIQALKMASELEKFSACPEKAEEFRRNAEALLQALPQLIEENAYLINYLDADGLRHGVVGAAKYAYLETNPNIDASAWGLLSKEAANHALDRIKAVSPTPLAVCVWPIHDDAHWSYQKNDPAYGGAGDHWNGSAWFSSQARYLLALLRHNRFDDAFAVGEAMRSIHESGTMRDVMADYGRTPAGRCNPDAPDAYYVDGYGTFGALFRGLFEVVYSADQISLTPHLPPEMNSYLQKQPIFWGEKKIFPKITGCGGSVAKVLVNKKNVPLSCDNGRIELDYGSLPTEAEVEFCRN